MILFTFHNWGRPVTSLHYVCRNLLGAKKTQVETSPAPVACFIIQCHCLWRPLAVCVVSFCYVVSLLFFGFELLEPGHYQRRALRFCGVLFCLLTSLACLCALSVELSWPGFCIHGDNSKMTDCVVERTCQYVSGHYIVSPNQAGKIPVQCSYWFERSGAGHVISPHGRLGWGAYPSHNAIFTVEVSALG